ncbi:MAG: ATP-binding protein [Planctomycetes bacterium]|nr:ATP-binding protein [Planctomycetota bacterium]
MMLHSPLLRHIFADVSREDSPDVLWNCYVLPGETKLREEQFEALLLDRPPAFVRNVVTVSSRNAFERFQADLQECLTIDNKPHTVLIVGGIGVGKTMFLRRFFNLTRDLREGMQQTCAFYVDFRTPGLDPEKLPELIYRRIREQVEALDGKPVPGDGELSTYDFSSSAALQQMFWSDYQRFLRGPEGTLRQTDEKEFERLRVAFLARHRDDDRAFIVGAVKVIRDRYHQRVCLILDNADQCEPPYQKAVYLFSRTLEADLRCLVVCALREEWYWYFGVRGGGPLSAYQDVVFHIPAPRSRDVLSKRLEYAMTLAARQEFPRASAYLGTFVPEARHLQKYLECCKSAFFEEEEITVFYECLSNGSVRRALDIFLEFLRSGHTHVEEYLRAFAEGRQYRLTFHQVFKSVAFGSYFYYRAARSLIPNVFSPVRCGAGSLSYLGTSYLLRWLGDRARLEGPVGEGYVQVPEVKEFMHKLGIPPGVEQDTLKDLVHWGLLEPYVPLTPEPSVWSHLRVTAFGLYLVTSLVGRYPYIEAVMLDTPISVQGLHRRIASLYSERVKPSLTQRLLCVQDFLDYLHVLEELEQDRLRVGGLAPQCSPLVPAIRESIKPDVERIQKAIAEELRTGRQSLRP